MNAYISLFSKKLVVRLIRTMTIYIPLPWVAFSISAVQESIQLKFKKIKSPLLLNHNLNAEDPSLH